MKPGTMVICLASNICVRLPARALMSALLPDGGEAAVLDRERLRPRRARIHGVDLRVEYHQIGILLFGGQCNSG